MATRISRYDYFKSVIRNMSDKITFETCYRIIIIINKQKGIDKKLVLDRLLS